MRLSLRLVAATLLAVVAALAVGRAEIVEQVLVKVNGDIISKTDLEQRQVQLLRQRNLQLSDDAALKKALADITPQVIADAIDELLLVQRGKELGYKMDDADFNRVVDQIRKENKLDKDEQFEAALKAEGMTLADLRKSLERQMLIARVQQAEVTSKIGITEEEARAYHAEHVNEFTSAAQVTLREVTIAARKDDRGISVGAEEEAKQQIEAARQRIVNGESFEKVASEVSTSASRANGGLVGPLNKSELAPALVKLLDELKPGDVSQPLRTATGYQILKIETITAEAVLPPEQARDKIADALYDQKRRAELKKYLAKLRSQAIIEWKNEEVRKAWESVVKQDPPPTAPEPAPPTGAGETPKPAKPSA
jgi:peptidyl-prolyl cis-trans isomerase SurA